MLACGPAASSNSTAEVFPDKPPTRGKQVGYSVGVRESVSKSPNVIFFSDKGKAALAVRP